MTTGRAESAVAACLIDLDGTVYCAGAPIPGAAAAVRAIRSAGLPIAFATNTSRKPKSALVARLAALDIDVSPDELHTAPVAAAGWLAAHGARRVSLLLPEETHEEFGQFELDDVRPEFVVVGDLGEAWTYDVLDSAFQSLRCGAGLVAVHRNRSWDAGRGPQLDAGPFVAALEYASGQTAVLVGKPSPVFFRTAAARLGVPLNRVAVVGDGIENDIGGAQNVGALGVAVRTGSFREADLGRLAEPPEAILDSIADLPGWLGLG